MRSLIATLFLYALLILLMAACYTVEVPEDQDWQLWPRRGTVPLATDGCYTDGCLEYREAVLARNLKGE